MPNPNSQFVMNFERPLDLYSPSEIYDQLDAQMLARLGEDKRIERKPGTVQPRALDYCFSMWSNTKPDGGLIIIGQEDQGPVSGCRHVPKSHVNEIERAAVVYCPDAKYSSKQVQVVNSKGEEDYVLVFHVHYRPDRVVRTVSNDAYVRVGSSKKKLSDAEIRELEIDKGQVDYEQELVDLSFPRDFDMNLVGQFVQNVHRSYRLAQAHSDTEVLEHRRLGKIRNGKFAVNVAGALLFAKEPCAIFPGCKVRFLRFEGETEGTGAKWNAVNDITLEANIPTLIVEVERTLDDQLRTFSRLGPDNKFYTAPEYPKAAWYEAIVNACVHRSYNLRNMNIFVKMFDDRLVVESPGGFPAHVTPQNIYNVHHPRNPHLMGAMFHLDYVKAANEGTRRMRDTMREMNLPMPEFGTKGGGDSFPLVRVVLRNNIKQRKVWIDADVTAFVAERIISELTDDEKRIINWAAENGGINVSQAQRLTNRSWHSANNLLRKLSQKGIFSHIHKQHGKKGQRDPNAHYVLSDRA
ncbi:MAG TPA: ATP-binding protein [Terriglobia bacterium]|nr:ATP-binding protein [Terriglobia bacterium]